jgi:hypothetical protein
VKDRHPLRHALQRLEGTEMVDVISDACGLDDGMAGLFVDELAAKVSNHEAGYTANLSRYCLTRSSLGSTLSTERLTSSNRLIRLTYISP